MTSRLAAAGGLVAATAVVSLGLWDVPGRLIVPAAVAATALAIALCGVAVRRSWPNRSELPLSVVFYTWLYLVPSLLAVGFMRRALALDFVLPLKDSVAYAERTDLVLTAGLFLNGALPLGGLIAASVFQRRRWRLFAIAISGALILFLLVYAVATIGHPLFGFRTRIVKP